MRLKYGTRVNTPLGKGEVVGEESFFGGKLARHLVKLDDPSKWALGRQTNVAAFFDRDISELPAIVEHMEA